MEEYYFHGTSEENAEKILNSGINPETSKYQSTVYLTKNHGEASKYAKIASSKQRGVVLKIKRSNLKQDHVKSEHSGIMQYKGKIDKEHISKV